jgi:hypothetical protein
LCIWYLWLNNGITVLIHSMTYRIHLFQGPLTIGTHNILEPTRGVTFFNSGFKSDPTELFPSVV